MGKTRKFEQNLETDLTILHPSEALSGRLRRVADFLAIATPVAVPEFELKISRSLARFFTYFWHPRHNLDDLRCSPNNLRLVARFYWDWTFRLWNVWVVSGALRLNRRRPATIRVLCMCRLRRILRLNRSKSPCVSKDASDRIAESLRRSLNLVTHSRKTAAEDLRNRSGIVRSYSYWSVVLRIVTVIIRSSHCISGWICILILFCTCKNDTEKSLAIIKIWVYYKSY